MQGKDTMAASSIPTTPPSSANCVEDAVIDTIETVLPQSAHTVEAACSEIIQQFMKISDNVREQAKLIQSMIDHFNSIHTNDKTLTLDEFIGFVNTTTIMAIEKNLLFSHYGYVGSRNMEGIIDKLDAAAKLLEGDKREDFKTSAKDIRNAIDELGSMRDKMSEVSLSKNEREVCMKDFEILSQIALESPLRNKAFNDIAERAIQCAKNINESCNNTIIQMQFQDRNTQISENLKNMLETYRELFVKTNHQVTDLETFDKIYDGIRLEDIRKVFLSTIQKAGHKTHDVPEKETHKHNENIELF